MSDHIKDAWAELGIAFASGNATEFAGDPERAIIDLIKSHEFPMDKKMMRLLMLWLTEFSFLVHVERLKSFLSELSPWGLSLLAGISQKVLKSKDHRWACIVSEAERRLGEVRMTFERSDDNAVLARHGRDQELEEYGIQVAPLRPANEKKLKSREWILKNNCWLRNRVLFGANLRADIATVMQLDLASTAYKAAKILKCSPNAAYRNWNALEEVGWRTISKTA